MTAASTSDETRERAEPPQRTVSLYSRPHGIMTDCYGRHYLVGDTPRDIMGHGRRWVLITTAAALAAAGILQYGFGSLAVALVAGRGWSVPEVMGVLALWAVCQGGSALPVAWLRRSRLLSARGAMLLGAALTSTGLLALGHTQHLAWLLIGYGICGGLGTGLVYHTGTFLVTSWYPERPAARTGLVSGAYACGSVPLILALGLGLGLEAGGTTRVITALAVVTGAVIALCGWWSAAPPPHWWPDHVDPRRWARDKRLNHALHGNPPAGRDCTLSEVWRSGSLPTMYAVLAMAGAVSLFNIAYLPVFAVSSGFGPAAAGAAAAVLVAANGVSRFIASHVSDYLGRCQTLSIVLALGGIAQFGLLFSGLDQALLGLLGFALLAGLGGGAFYPLFAALAVDYFGVRDAARNHGLVYSAKVFGGLLGVGGTAVVLTVAQPAGYPAAFGAAGALALLAALLTRRFRRPLHISTLPKGGG